MIFSNIFENSFYFVQVLVLQNCWWFGNHTFHHKNNQNMVNFHKKHPISGTLFSLCVSMDWFKGKS